MQHCQLDKIGSPRLKNLDPRNVGSGKTGGNEEGIQTESHCVNIGYLSRARYHHFPIFVYKIGMPSVFA